MQSVARPGRDMFTGVVLLGLLLMFLAGCSPDDERAGACVEDGRVLNVGFYAFFAPVSQSADENPDSDGFNTHLGYEADLLAALGA
ncbi:MAG: hypothetical protein OXG11_14025, partial [Chloroflexi bacterium]|nr:hypothetical protein [Chloroflexota bacterium]